MLTQRGLLGWLRDAVWQSRAVQIQQTRDFYGQYRLLEYKSTPTSGQSLHAAAQGAFDHQVHGRAGGTTLVLRRQLHVSPDCCGLKVGKAAQRRMLTP